VRTIRIYQKSDFQPGTELELSEQAAHHVGTVLRLREGHALQLFNGNNQQCTAVIRSIHKKQIIVSIESAEDYSCESPLDLHLGQALAKGERMEWVIQKSVELGVRGITPLLTEHCAVKLDTRRMEKKVAQWQAIAISACEQCGRNYVPFIHPLTPFEKFIQEQPEHTQRLILDPVASTKLSDLHLKPVPTSLIIGPEGGFSDQETSYAKTHGFRGLSLGRRILRTETAAIVSQSLLQGLLGDL